MVFAKAGVAGLVCVGLWACTLLAADPPAAGALAITDGSGKEHKVKGWAFTQGTRRLSWLDPVKDDPGGKAKGVKGPGRPRPTTGPEALEFRAENSTTFLEGIATLVPLDRLRVIAYDDKDGVTVRVFLGAKADDDLVLKGTTKYKGINKIAIEAEVDKGELGVAQLKFLGGVPKGIRSVRFESPKAEAAVPAGRPALVLAADRAKTAHPVSDLLPLYQLPDGSEQLLPLLMFKKTLKVDVSKVQKVVAHEFRDPDNVEWTVTLKDGSELTLTLLRTVTHEGKTFTLEGLLGRVRAGYKLFPLHTLAEVRFDEPKPDPNP